LVEVARVSHPNGHVLVYTNFATDLLEPAEADRLNGPLGNVAESMDEANTEDAFAKAGLQVVRKDVISTEWREYEEERDKPASFDLLRLRTRRARTGPGRIGVSSQNASLRTTNRRVGAGEISENAA
jgi:hypothetical protein